MPKLANDVLQPFRTQRIVNALHEQMYLAPAADSIRIDGDGLDSARATETTPVT